MTRISRNWLVSIGVSLALFALLWSISSATAQGPAPQGGVSVAAAVSSKINYQGVLKEGGSPVTGTRDMVFRFYSTSGCTTQVGSDIVKSGVSVTDGLFSVDLDVTHSDFNGQALWLRVQVGATAIGCQEILPVPYALSLRPGAQVAGAPTAWTGSVLEATMDSGYPAASAVYGNAATGNAVRGDSAGGTGVYGYTEDGYGVYGYDAGSLAARGYGGYFSSANGVGVYGYSAASPYFSNMHAPGVYGRSANGVGVYGYSTGSSSSSYGGYFYSANFRGIYARSDANYYDAYFDGDYGVYVKGDIVAGGSKAGYVVDVALNDDALPLELGDVVVIVGVAEPVLGEIPMIRVKKADAANSTGVMGVVDRKFVAAEVGAQGTGVESDGHFVDPGEISVADAGIASGEYVGVVTLGAFKAIKVDASYGPIQPGDLLVSSPNPGCAMKAVEPKIGTVIGKALAGLDAGTGVIAVLITLQ